MLALPRLAAAAGCVQPVVAVVGAAEQRVEVKARLVVRARLSAHGKEHRSESGTGRAVAPPPRLRSLGRGSMQVSGDAATLLLAALSACRICCRKGRAAPPH